jgi:4-hydroxybenzoate polyprenyltransferase
MTSSRDRRADPGPWLQLLRPANVITALADILAGAAVAGAPWSSGVAWLLPSSACLYAGGVVLNDCFDRRIDAIERPERPIPSGRISIAAAATLGGGLLAVGIALAAGAGPAALRTAAAVAALVVLYDALGKHHAFLGPVNMGACRAGNLLLGMAVVPGAAAIHWPLAGLPLAYIAGVTVISRGEVGGSKRPVAFVALGLVIAVVAALVGVADRTGGTGSRIWALVVAAGFGARVVPAFWRAWQHPVPGPIRLAVRTGVLSLVLLDAGIAAAYADIMVSLAVLATGVLAWWLARLFAVT